MDEGGRKNYGDLVLLSLCRLQRMLVWIVPAMLLTPGISATDPPPIHQVVHSDDASGILEKYRVVGKRDFQHEACFTAFGVPGNRWICVSCHLPDQGWTITSEGVHERFYHTVGLLAATSTPSASRLAQ